MCTFCYVYEIEFVGEGFLAVIEKPRTVMTRIKCECGCDDGSLTEFEGNAQCERCGHYIIGRDRARKTKERGS